MEMPVGACFIPSPASLFWHPNFGSQENARMAGQFRLPPLTDSLTLSTCDLGGLKGWFIEANSACICPTLVMSSLRRLREDPLRTLGKNFFFPTRQNIHTEKRRGKKKKKQNTRCDKQSIFEPARARTMTGLCDVRSRWEANYCVLTETFGEKKEKKPFKRTAPDI